MNYSTDPLASVLQATPTSTDQGTFDRTTGQPILQTIDPDRSAGDPNAVMNDITNGMWSRVESKYIPLMDALQKYTTYNGNEGIEGQLLDQAKADTTQSFESAANISARKMAGMGMAPTAAESAAMAKDRQFAEGMAQVDSANRIRTLQQDLNRQIATGMPGVSEVRKTEEKYL